MGGLVLGIAPVFVLIAIGYGLRKSGFLPDAAWRPIEKLSINLLYPGFLVPAIWSADLSGASAGPAGGAAVLSVTVVAILALLAKPMIRVNGPAYTSVFQGVIRWNSFVFLPVVQSLFGAEGLAVAAVMIACIIPVTNIACVAVLARWGADQRGVSPLALFQAMLKNPILMACLIGLLLNFAGVPTFPVLARILDLLGGAALPLGLIVAGAGLSFAEVMRRRVTVLWVSVVKLLVMPFLMWGVCRLLGGDQLAQALALLCGATPGAAASYMLARQMGGDAPLMAGVIALTTVGGAITMPILLMLFHFV
ncbi:AEC family transporter [Brevundimonas sp. PAMC22021]|uniref:AEC family transporter n=1 Tax=Brevundimonas sp. PAMC22021 TaxID=2861285 RepID=UPI001C633216|nr:AEC family transporter [Brevundimonas sp. PAMC22021]QYF85669.1 AEC family transporter [Brevundimonas sp. PAMC22021]